MSNCTRLVFAGDVALFGKFIEDNTVTRAYLKSLKDYFQLFDHVIVNLETPLVEVKNSYLYKSAYIYGLSSSIEVLKYLGVTAVNLANNHTLDFGSSGLQNTIEVLNEAKIEYFGTIDKPYFEIQEEVGSMLRIHGYVAYDSSPFGVFGASQKLQSFSYKNLLSDLRKDKEDGASSVIFAHYGTEHTHFVKEEYKSLFKKLANDFNFAWLGHHSHTVQERMDINESIAYFSLGNCLFDDVLDVDGRLLYKLNIANRIGLTVEARYKDGISEFTHKFVKSDFDRLKIISDPQALNYLALEDYPELNPSLDVDRDKVSVCVPLYRRGAKWWLSRINVRGIFIACDMILNRLMHYFLLKRRI